jgi:hypothetical protein
MKTFKVIFSGRGRGSKFPHTLQTITIHLKEKPTEETDVLPELNKKWEVWDLIEIWEKIF